MALPIPWRKRMTYQGVRLPESSAAPGTLDGGAAPGPRDRTILRHIRGLGGTGSVLMAIGALGAGAQPVLQNPTQGVRILGLFSRASESALTMCLTGAAMVVLAWLLLGRYTIGGGHGDGPAVRVTRSQLNRTIVLWALPLTVAPPMFSRDVYSYLAQSEISAMGLDPYKFGPGPALGVGHVLTRTVPTIWRDTPDPYGPLFLWIGRGISVATRDNIIAGIFLQRLLEIGGVALLVWALPRLARRCGASGVAALWLGAANPLVLFHLVSGIHNEALMLGLMLAGFELAMTAVDSVNLRDPGQWARLVGGCGLIALSWTVKLPSVMALGFVGLALARRLDRDAPGRPRRNLLVCVVLTGAVVAAVTVIVSYASGLGFGWFFTFGVGNSVRSWMSLSTAVGVITGFAGVLLGLGDHTNSMLALTRPLGIGAAAVVVLWALAAVYRGRLPAIAGLGIALGAVALGSPVVQPWYFLWGIVPLAAWARTPAVQHTAVAFSAAIALMLMPNGADYPLFSIIEAILATILAVGLLVLATRRRLPWTRVPQADG